MSVIIAIVTLGLLIFIHELGHMIAAKFRGVSVPVFSLGFGPPLISFFDTLGGDGKRYWLFKLVGQKKPLVFSLAKRRFRSKADRYNEPALVIDIDRAKSTEWRLGFIPIGGFVSLTDEDDLKPVDNLIISAAGPFANLVVAALLVAGLAVVPHYRMVANITEGVTVSDSVSLPSSLIKLTSPEVRVVEITKDSPAYLAGLRAGDHVTIINGYSALSLVEDQATFSEGSVVIQVERFDQLLDIQWTSEDNTGVKVANTALVSGRLWTAPIVYVAALAVSVPISAAAFYLMGKDILSGNGKEVTKGLSGPIGIVRWAGEENLGIVETILRVAVVSLSLAISNLLPIPILDGGGIVLSLIEICLRRKLPENFRLGLSMTGALLLISLFGFATINDIIAWVNNTPPIVIEK